MKPIFWRTVLIPCAIALSVGIALPADDALPVVDGRELVASVNGEPITLDAFADALAQAHQGSMMGDHAAPKLDPTQMLDRLIGAELVLQEAVNIGLDELPRFEASVDLYRMQALRGMLYSRRVREMLTPDPAKVEALYRPRVKQVELDSLLYEVEGDAVAALARLDADEPFDILIKEAEADSNIESEHYDFLAPAGLSPGVRDAVATMEPGQHSGVLPIGGRFGILRLVDVRYPEDPAIREEVERSVLKEDRGVAWLEYVAGLIEETTKIDDELFESLDYSVDGPGLEAMLADERVLAKIKDSDPITVGVLTSELEKKAFHGAQRAMEQGKFDQRKHPLMDDLLKRRVVDAEVKRQKIEQSDEFRALLEQYRRRTLFSLFVEQIVSPAVKLDEEQVRQFIAAHSDEYSTPEMVRMDALAFLKREDAERAVEKLRSGADFRWMRDNATGQAVPDDSVDPMSFDGRRPVVVNALPVGVRKSIVGAEAGDARFHAASDGLFYVFVVRELVASQPQDFELVKEPAANRLFAEKRKAALDQWIADLRAASEIEIYGSVDMLLAQLGMNVSSDD